MTARIRGVAIVIAGITIGRLAYNVWLSPYELIADEAQYWDWSRRLDWSYYSKGPGVAWLVAVATRLLGDAEWAIRTPAALSLAVVMSAIAWLTRAMFPAHGRAASMAPLLVFLVPAYQLTALLMTIDAPYLACWAAALCAGWRAWMLERAGRPGRGWWIAFGFAVGAGFLFKYTALFLVPGFFVFAWADRSSVRTVDWWKRAGAAGLAIAASTAPVVLWNVRHDAAGLAHLLGYLRIAGGDRPQRGPAASILTAIEYPFAQVAIMGPVLLLAWLGLRALRRTQDADDRRARRYALCMSMPMLAFFAAASFRTRVEANWPMAAFLSLVPMAAFAAAGDRHRAWWRATIVYGIVALGVIHMPLSIARIPAIGTLVPVHRFYGNRERALAFADDVADFRARTAGRGVIVAPGHNDAGLLAYYLPGRPAVASAGRLFGLRPSAYDFFDDTNLESPKLAGRPALLMTGGRTFPLVVPPTE